VGERRQSFLEREKKKQKKTMRYKILTIVCNLPGVYPIKDFIEREDMSMEY
jgi:hypothetical protein